MEMRALTGEAALIYSLIGTCSTSGKLLRAALVDRDKADVIIHTCRSRGVVSGYL